VATTCSICKKEEPGRWRCLVCARAGFDVLACSGVCRQRHERDGRHRQQLKLESRAGIKTLARDAVWALLLAP
jgi:hypothetical protein